MTDYETFSDENLIREYKKTNDINILDTIIVRYHSLISKCAAPLYLVGADCEDLISEGHIGLLSAINSYDDKSCDMFYPFAKLCIRRAQFKAIEAQNRKKHVPLNTCISIDEESTGNSELLSRCTLSTEEIVLDVIKMEEILDDIEKVLSPMEMTVLLYTIDGFTYSQISKKLGKNEKSIHNAMQRVRSKVSEILKP